jgi:16S rRNA (cytosine1402-N4)-methyltransferase
MHYSVLLNESIDNLAIKEDGIYVDATVGYGGHSSEILKRLKRGFLFAFDADKEATQFAEHRLSEISSNFKIFHDNFSNLKDNLEKENISSIDGFLFDLGVSSPQIDEAKRGFSFMRDGYLDMRMDTSKDKSAYDVVNTYSYEDLTNIFFKYGEEKLSKVIAKKIVSERINKEIKTTKELVNIIESAVGAKYFNKFHPERQIFQAIRIEVNSELKVLESVLPDAIDILNKGGRISVITFHSLEDRIVKQIFKKESEVDELVKGLPVIPKEYEPRIKLVNKKPILPTEKELKENSRSKSAKLRIIERV